MNRIAVFGAVAMLAWVVVAYAQDGKVRAFHGEVSDSQCALNVHSLTRSHAEMLKIKSMGVGDARSCSQYCIQHQGGELVLVAGKTVFHLDNQNQVRQFAGQKAKIMGTLDPKTTIIHVVTVEIEAQAVDPPR